MLRENMTNALGGIADTAQNLGSSINSVAQRLGSMGTQRRNLVGGEGNLPTLLRGASAALTGQVPQFRQQLMQEQQFQTAQGLQNLDIKNALATSAAQDSLQIRNMLLMNNDAGAMEILQDRMSLESDLGASSEATQQLMNLIQTDPMQAFMNVDAAVRSAYQLGLIKVPEQDELSISQLREVGSSARKLNSTIDEITTAYNKVKGLEAEMRKGSRSAINAGIMNVARLISPGVVTDSDARQIAGADTPISVLMQALQGKGMNIDQILRVVDPTSPETFDVDALMAVADSVTAAGIPGVYDSYEDLQNTARSFGANSRFMSAYFDPDSKRMNSLAKIRNQVNEPSQPESQLSYKFNSLADAQAAFEAGVPVELIMVDENNSGIYKPVKFENENE
tara:strand:- start:8963 stop:10144 length:1182 start_codon:yes stop_codon:yes gene_type:complete